MVDWTSDIDESAAADAGEFTTKVYHLDAVFGEASTRVFFRVEEAPEFRGTALCDGTIAPS